MEEELIIDSVAQKDRISIDVNDIRKEIESCRSDVAWSELPLAAKVRVLLRERLEELKAEQATASAEDKAEPTKPTKKGGK
jgi:hypothetical protein